jgi:hypothetical protein
MIGSRHLLLRSNPKSPRKRYAPPESRKKQWPLEALTARWFPHSAREQTASNVRTVANDQLTLATSRSGSHSRDCKRTPDIKSISRWRTQSILTSPPTASHPFRRALHAGCHPSLPQNAPVQRRKIRQNVRIRILCANFGGWLGHGIGRSRGQGQPLTKGRYFACHIFVRT